MKKIIAVLVLFIVILTGIVLVKTLSLQSRQIEVDPVSMPDFDYEEAAGRLGGAIRIPTISPEDTSLRDVAAFEAFIRFVGENFPLVHRRLQPELVNRYGLLYTWPGTDESLDPWLLTGHYDVVPVEPASPVSETDTSTFKLLHRSIKAYYPDALVAPYLVLGATDARHYTGLSDQVFRFMPVSLQNDDLALLHGINERISVREYARSIAFYRHLILEMENL
ncbi:MAG: M20/M25/M40 family metallo-hydrolase [Cyclonatronaceae bacterium]